MCVCDSVRAHTGYWGVCKHTDTCSLDTFHSHVMSYAECSQPVFQSDDVVIIIIMIFWVTCGQQFILSLLQMTQSQKLMKRVVSCSSGFSDFYNNTFHVCEFRVELSWCQSC